MGVDLGIKKVAIAVWEDGILLYGDAFTSPKLDRPGQLEDVSAWLFMSARSSRVDVIVIEDTLIGNNRKYSIRLAQTMGACLSALAEEHAKIILANVSHWKKEVLGKGNADKIDIRRHVNDIDVAYAALCGEDQDKFDAVCIGYYGVLLANRVGDTSVTGLLH